MCPNSFVLLLSGIPHSFIQSEVRIGQLSVVDDVIECIRLYFEVNELLLWLIKKTATHTVIAKITAQSVKVKLCWYQIKK